MKLLVPITIQAAMLTAASIAEPDTAGGEVAWASGTFAVGDRRVVAAAHSVYQCTSAGTSTDSPDTTAGAAMWQRVGPSNRWAAFDSFTSTQSTSTASVSYTLRPQQAFNAVALYGCKGQQVTVTVTEGPGGAVLFTYTGPLYEPAIGWWEWLFSRARTISKLVVRDIPIAADPVLTVTVDPLPGESAAIGILALGDLRAIIGDAEWGGTQKGASAEPKTYSYIDTDEFGSTVIKQRPSATDMSATVKMPRASADYALACVQEVLDVPAAWIATDANGYAGLNVFGLGKGAVKYDVDDGATTAELSLNVMGFI